ncbi:MAG: imidazolonepropionase [Rhizobiales bacterium]|nr:imidazolonepropionase [Hyphomicrobiales bacterium]
MLICADIINPRSLTINPPPGLFGRSTWRQAVSPKLLTNATLATMRAGAGSYGLITHGAIAIDNERIAWVGPQVECPDRFSSFAREDQGGRLVTPGLIDCHTHLVFGGNRAREFEMRLEGASYEEIARAGGGIVSTVAATRGASEAGLLAATLARADALIAEGVTTLEIKSGYGLDVETELRMLRVARQVARERAVEVRTSFLGAHAVPPEHKGEADRYIDDVCIPALRAAHAAGLADAVDGFCEGIAFSPAQIERVFAVARELRLPVKLHAGQLSNLGGAALAARYGALSVDHLEHLDEEGAAAMAAAGTVAVILPGAFYTLRETQLPPIGLLRRAGVAMAVASDCNPGSSPMTSLLLAMNMACTLFRMTPEEALAGVTREAARALGLSDRGVIGKGRRADLAIWNVEHPAELAYRIGFNPLHARIFEGA